MHIYLINLAHIRIPYTSVPNDPIYAYVFEPPMPKTVTLIARPN